MTPDISRLIFVRICEDVELTTRKISNSGIAVWRDFVRNIKGNYQHLLHVAFKDVASICPALLEGQTFEYCGQGDDLLDDILERILFRLNAFSFRDMELRRDGLNVPLLPSSHPTVSLQVYVRR